MADQDNHEPDECPQCQKRTLLRAVVDQVKAAVVGEPQRHEHPEFLVCPVCGWNNLPERWEQSRR